MPGTPVRTHLPGASPWPLVLHDAGSSSVRGTRFLSLETHLPRQGSAPAPEDHGAWLSGTIRAPPGGLTAGRRSKTRQHAQVGDGAGRSPGRDGASVLGRKSRVHRSSLWDAPPLSRRQRGRARVGVGRAQGPGTEARGVGGMDTIAQSRFLHSTGLGGHTHVLCTQKVKINK